MGVTERDAIDEVLAFWFGDEPDDAALAEGRGDLWWGASTETDHEIAMRFGALRKQAIAGGLAHWTATPRGQLARIILIDQFSRNIFRGQPEAFAHDGLALHWCHEGLTRGADRALRPIERAFFYLPLEHAESRADQALSVQLCEALAAEVPEVWRDLFDYYADYARRHRDIIERYGRFPHRNAVLGRDSTEAESEFLEQPGSSF